MHTQIFIYLINLVANYFINIALINKVIIVVNIEKRFNYN